jgi:hypothetical protein
MLLMMLGKEQLSDDVGKDENFKSCTTCPLDGNVHVYSSVKNQWQAWGM